MSGFFKTFANGTMLSLALLMGACVFENPEEYAKIKLQNIEFSEVLSVKQLHWSTYGCTYVVVRLSANATSIPPESQDIEWYSTPLSSDIDLDGRKDCLASPQEGLSNAGLDGYGEKFLEIIASSGAWAQVYGGSESQILKVYAPEFNLAMYLRYGD